MFDPTSVVVAMDLLSECVQTVCQISFYIFRTHNIVVVVAKDYMMRFSQKTEENGE